MKKRIFTALLAVMLVVSLGTVSALADGYTELTESSVAMTGGLYYDSLAAAVGAAKPNGTVEVLAGTCAEDITIDKAGLTLKGAGAASTILTGTVIVDAKGVTLDGLWFQQTYTDADNENTVKLRTTANGSDLTISNCVVQRMTGHAVPYGFIVYYGTDEGTLTFENTELIAPVAGDTGTIHAASPSVIGHANANSNSVKLVMDGCTVRTNGYVIFNRWNNAEYIKTVFTGLEGVEISDPEVTVTSCYMALNSTHVGDMTFAGCTFENMRSWGMLAAGDSLEVTGCEFDGSNQSRAISFSYGTINEAVITGNTFDLENGYGIKFENALTTGSKVTIEGNTFKNCNIEDSYCVSNVDGSGEPAQQEIKVSGSVFENCGQRYAGSVYLENSETPNADKAVLVSGSVESYFDSLAKAVAAASNGDTIRLLADIDEQVSVSKVITILTDGNELAADKLSAGEGYVMQRINGGYTFRAEPQFNVPDTYQIKVAEAAGGTVAVSITNANEGAVITVTATPDKGCELAYVTVDGERISGTSFTMPGHDVTVSAVFVLAGLPFADVTSGDWYYDAVRYVYASGLMEGVSDTAFEPNGGMTRAMVWAILARLDGVTVTGSNWAETARSWAMAEGVSDGENASGAVTREQLVTMLYRYDGEPAVSGALTGWADAASVSGWAGTAMAWAVNEGIITGATEATLAPAAGATRAQCAAILMRYVEA